MTEIDEKTGLPKLPNGQFWVVAEKNNGYFGARYISVSIVQRMKVTRFKTIDFFLFTIPSKKTYITFEDRVLIEQIVWDPESEIGLKGVEMKVEGEDGNICLAMDPDKLTAEHLRRVAEHVIKLKDIKDEAVKLMGVYPPNSISQEA